VLIVGYVAPSSVSSAQEDKKCIKFASHYLSFYAVYIYQKSPNYFEAFKCYKQKRQFVPISLGHPVCIHAEHNTKQRVAKPVNNNQPPADSTEAMLQRQVIASEVDNV